MLVCCLCADWCSNCREYRATFAAIERQFEDVRFRWIDIEDESELVGDVDIDDFPMLLIATAGEPRFFGPLMPQREVLARLVEAHRSGADHAPLPNDKVRALVSRLR